MKLLNWFLLLIFSSTLLLVSITNAQLDIGYDDTDFPRVEVEIPPSPINYSILQTNSSNWWGGHYYTDYDLLVPYTGATGNVDLGSWNLTGDYLFGRMDDLIVDTIQVDIINSSIYQDTSLVLNLQFNNNQSIDSSIYGNDGTFKNGTHSERDVLELDGVDDYTDVSHNPSLDFTSKGELAISACVKMDSYRYTYNPIMTKINGDGLYPRLLPRNDGFTLWQYKLDGATQTITSNISVNLGEWNYYEAEINANTFGGRLYINNIIAGIDTTTGSIDGSTASRNIGYDSNLNDYLDGSIKWIKLRNRIPTEAIRAEDYADCTRYGYYNNLYVNELNTTGEAWFEDEVHHQGDVHFEDDVKECKGSADDVCREFNQTDLVYTAEVGSPRVIWDGFGDFIFNGGNVSIGTFGILQSGDWTYLSGDGSIEVGFDIAIPKYGNRDFYYGYGGIENHFFGNAGELKIDKDGNLITTGSGSFGGDLDVVGNVTIGDKITFAFGEIIDNLIDGWLTITGSLNVTGNVTAENVFLPAYAFAHTDANISIDSAGAWYNITFNEEASDPILDISHTYNDATNDTFTIGSDGIYLINWHIAFVDFAANPTGHVVTRVIKNGVEIPGSVLEKDTTKQNDHVTIDHNVLIKLSANDELKVQITADVTTVSTETIGTYGVHKDSGIIDIHRIA